MMTTTKADRSGLLNRIIELSLRNRLLVAFGVALATVLGVMAYRAMETDLSRFVLSSALALITTSRASY
jgi:hypothetical protein